MMGHPDPEHWQDERDEWRSLPLRSFVQTAISHRRLLLFVLVLCPLAAIIWTFFQPTLYTARASLLPRETSNLPQGIFGNFIGLESLGLGGSGQEDLYAQIVVSDRLLEPLINEQWTLPGVSAPVTLVEFLDDDASSGETEDDDQAMRRFRVKDYLRSSAISFRKDKLTDFMILKVTLPRSPTMAASVANYLVNELERYNTAVVKTQASEQRQFIEKRLVEVQESLYEAEDALVTFKEENRGYESSPELQLIQDRLSRDVRVQSAIWEDLRRQLEMVKVDEVRDRVSLNVLDRADPPVVRSSPNRRLAAIAGAILGVVLALAITVFLRIRQSLGELDETGGDQVSA